MGIGHVAVALGLKRADRQLNTGWLIFAALLCDFLLGWFTLLGWESYVVPADYASRHYVLFTFPWSHGLAADVAWAAAAGSIAWLASRRPMAATAVAVAVLSHFLLDGVVHVKGLPLTGYEGPVLGLGLWENLPLELGLEVAMAAAGLWIYRRALPREAPRRGTGMTIYIVLLTALMVGGQAGAARPPGRREFLASWLMMTPLMAAVAFRLDRDFNRAIRNGWARRGGPPGLRH